MGGDDNSELLTGLLSSQVPGGSQGVSLRLTVAAVQAFAYMAPLDTRKAVRASTTPLQAPLSIYVVNTVKLHFLLKF